MSEAPSKKVFLINSEEHYIRGNFAKAAQKLSVPYETIDLKECIFYADGRDVFFYHNHRQIKPEDGYFYIRRKSEDSYYCYLLVEFLSQYDGNFTDPSNLSHNLNQSKLSQLVGLTPQGVPFPESFVCRPYSYLLHKAVIIETLGFPCVVKRDGARGEAVWLINNEQELDERIGEAPMTPSLIQKYIPNEFDFRVIVFEDQVIGAMKRQSIDGFANTAADAILEPHGISDEERALALEASKKAGIDFAGVDIVHTAEGLKVWEINTAPQLHRFDRAMDMLSMEVVMQHIRSKYLQ